MKKEETVMLTYKESKVLSGLALTGIMSIGLMAYLIGQGVCTLVLDAIEKHRENKEIES